MIGPNISQDSSPGSLKWELNLVDCVIQFMDKIPSGFIILLVMCLREGFVVVKRVMVKNESKKRCLKKTGNFPFVFVLSVSLHYVPRLVDKRLIRDNSWQQINFCFLYRLQCVPPI